MKRLLLLSTLLALVSSVSEAAFIDRLIYLKKQKDAAQSAEGMDFLSKIPGITNFWKYIGGVSENKTGTFDQKVDHFNTSDTRTFKQRYWVSSYGSADNAPVIYYICGESRCEAPSGFAVTIAKELDAKIVTLEHRYYGDSIPTPTYSAGDLKYLSVDEALADFSEFQKYAMKEWGFTGPWITIGGSYPGALSAYYRLTFPKLAAGALASSAPVEARAKFEEYDYDVATVIDDACLANIKKAVDVIEDKLKTDSTRAAVKKTFESEKVTDDVDFLYIVADMAAASIQYGQRVGFCSELADAKTTDKMIKAYADSGLRMFSELGITPMQDTPQGNLSENPKDYTDAGMRQWYYQSCTEFGYWQVAYHDPKYSSRSPRIDLAYHDGICDRMFGIKHSVDTSYINKTYFQPILDGKASQILFTNGSDDPWKYLSISDERGNIPSTVNAAEVAGGSHCSDLGNSDIGSIGKAQNLFRSLVKEWIK